MKIKFILFWTTFFLFVFIANHSSFAQISKKDSILNTIKEKRSQDSIARIVLKNKLQLQKDSLLLSIKNKRTQDSINRISLVQQRISERKQQDSITAFKRKFLKDSIDASKNGITIRLSDIEKEKQDEKNRLKKLEGKIAKQRLEDSIAFVKKLALEKENKRIQDSISLENKKIELLKQQLLIALEKHIQDSITLERQVREEKQRVEKEKLIAEQKRIQDSITLDKQVKEEKLRVEKEKLIAQEKRIQDSITLDKQVKEEKLRVEKEKLIAQEKRIQDSITLDKQIKEEKQRVEKEKLIAQEKRIQDSITLDKQVKEERQRIAQEKLLAAQKSYQDSVKQAQENKSEADKKAQEKLAIEQNKLKDSLNNAHEKLIEENKILIAKISAEQKRQNDSLKLMQELDAQKNNSVLAKYYANNDTSKFSKIELQQIKDSLDAIERIRLQELKYAKQRIEDSLYLISLQKKDTNKLVTITTTIDTTKKIDKTDSILVTKIIPEKTELLFLEKATYISFNFGPSNYLGDLGGNSGVGKGFLYDNNFKKRTYFYGCSFTKEWREAIALRIGYNAGSIAGSDNDVDYKNINDPAYYRYKRNLDFSTKISETSVLIELSIFKLCNKKSFLHNISFQPYGLIGIGRYKFNPQGSYYDEISGDYVLVDLAPLKTEGEGMNEYPDRKPYKLTQLNMPFGVGIKYILGTKTSIGFEFLGRKLFTDYLDDVSKTYINPDVYKNYFSGEDLDIAKSMNNKSSVIDPNNPFKNGEQRGNQKNNDFYYSFNFKLSIRISKDKPTLKKQKISISEPVINKVEN